MPTEKTNRYIWRYLAAANLIQIENFEDEETIKTQRYNFGKFFEEHDRRRETKFIDAFPELESFYYSTLEMYL